jgi:hypothetical protein
MYENGEMRPVETIEKREEEDGGGELNYGILS